MTDYNDGKWHNWFGWHMKPASVHEKSVIEYVWHDQNINTAGKTTRKAGIDDMDVSPAWSHILKFRVVNEHKEPREFWINPETKGMNTKPFPGYIHVREVIE